MTFWDNCRAVGLLVAALIVAPAVLLTMCEPEPECTEYGPNDIVICDDGEIYP